MQWCSTYCKQSYFLIAWTLISKWTFSILADAGRINIFLLWYVVLFMYQRDGLGSYCTPTLGQWLDCDAVCWSWGVPIYYYIDIPITLIEKKMLEKIVERNEEKNSQQHFLLDHRSLAFPCLLLLLAAAWSIKRRKKNQNKFHCGTVFPERFLYEFCS